MLARCTAFAREAAVQASFFILDAFARGLTRLRRRRDRCEAHVFGCWYGAAYLPHVMRCPQLLSGHRRGCQVLRCWRTPHSRPQANCLRPRRLFNASIASDLDIIDLVTSRRL